MPVTQFRAEPQHRLGMLPTMARRCDRRTARHGGRSLARAKPPSEGREVALVVGDQGPIRKATVQVLHRVGYQVLEASGALDAQRLAEAHGSIGLVLADFTTPETTGLELARWFQVRFPETKVLITTDSLWELLSQSGMHEQFGILVKPFSDLELRRMVQRLAGN
jgi:CheY-like chemotaxis protein